MSVAHCSEKKKSILLTLIYCKCLSKWDNLLNQSAINGEGKDGELCSGNLLKKGHTGEDGQILASTKTADFFQLFLLCQVVYSFLNQNNTNTGRSWYCFSLAAELKVELQYSPGEEIHISLQSYWGKSWTRAKHRLDRQTQFFA